MLSSFCTTSLASPKEELRPLSENLSVSAKVRVMSVSWWKGSAASGSFKRLYFLAILDDICELPVEAEI